MATAAQAVGAAPEDFFGVVADRFTVASESVGVIDRWFRIAGCDVRLRFAGPALVDVLVPALEHLEIAAPSEATRRVLTVCLWDSTSTHTAMPKAPWTWDDPLSFRCEVPGYNTERITTVFDLGARALSMLDADYATAVYWVQDAARVPSFERAAPLRTILHCWLATQGRQVVHSAAVGTERGGVLLVGEGGSGKSSTALACLESPLTYAGDDYCVVANDPEPWVYSLYCTAKADRRAMAALPGLNGLTNLEPSAEEKAILVLRERYAEKIVAGFPLKAVGLPCVEDRRDTVTTRVTSGEALRSLAPSTIQQLARADNDSWLRMSRLVRQVPCHRIHLGSERTRIPGALQDLLA